MTAPPVESECDVATVASRSISIPAPRSIADIGTGAAFAWDEFFAARIRNPHTRAAYLGAVRRFLMWAEQQGVALPELTPGMVGRCFDQHSGSIPTKKVHLAALKNFMDHLVTRHVLFINPAASVRGERYSPEGKTPEIRKDHARQLLASIDVSRLVGSRDRAILAMCAYTAARDGAIAGLRMGDLIWDGAQFQLRFAEKGGKERLIPVRHDLQQYLLAYLNCFNWQTAGKNEPLFRSVAGRTGRLTTQPIRNIDIWRMMKRRLADASLPTHVCPHSFRVAAITDLLEQGTPLEDVQQLAGHADPRTTRLYDRRQRRVTRNTVERISL